MPPGGYPGIRLPHDVRRFVARHPINSLSIEELYEERDYWATSFRLEGFQSTGAEGRTAAEVGMRQVLRYGGIGLAVAGIPASFVAWPIGLGLAIAGLLVTGSQEIYAFQDRRREGAALANVKPSLDRWEAVEAEIAERRKK